MSNRMSPCDRAGALRRRPKRMRSFALAIAALLAAAAPFTALPATDLSPVPLPTYTVGSTVDIKPNILEVGTETIPVHARVAEGEERDRIWTRQKERFPGFAEYEEKTSRQIPVLVLQRTS